MKCIYVSKTSTEHRMPGRPPLGIVCREDLCRTSYAIPRELEIKPNTFHKNENGCSFCIVMIFTKVSVMLIFMTRESNACHEILPLYHADVPTLAHKF